MSDVKTIQDLEAQKKEETAGAAGTVSGTAAAQALSEKEKKELDQGMRAMMALMAGGMSSPNLFMPGSASRQDLHDSKIPKAFLLCMPAWLCIVIIICLWQVFVAIFAIVVLAEDASDDEHDIADFECKDFGAADNSWYWMLFWTISTWTAVIVVPTFKYIIYPKSDTEIIMAALGQPKDETLGERIANVFTNALGLMIFVCSCAILHIAVNMPDDCKDLMKDGFDRENFWTEIEMIAYSFLGICIVVCFMLIGSIGMVCLAACHM